MRRACQRVFGGCPCCTGLQAGAPLGNRSLGQGKAVAGGLASAILEQGARESPSAVLPLLHSISLADRFTELCGSYQFAMSEHALDDESLLQRVKALISRDSRRMSTA